MYLSWYLAIGFVVSFLHNFRMIFYERETLFYRVWAFIYIAVFFPIALLVRIAELHPVTRRISTAIAKFFVGFVER